MVLVSQLTSESLIRLWKTGALCINKNLMLRPEDDDYDDVSI